MTYSVSTPAISGRTQEFNSGVTGTGNVASASLNADSAKQNALVPRKFVPTALNQQFMPSSNGMGEKDAQRITPLGQVPSSNGMSPSTYGALFRSYASTRPL